jgi:phosphotransferase system enzyme I (PtsI)
MLATSTEIDQTLELIRRARQSLEDEGTPYDRNVKVGGMIEVPAAALSLGMFIRKLDFLSIGTNDLIQYTLAVDRTDDRVSNRYEPWHPAVLRLLRQVRRAAAREEIPVSVCGEMASEPLSLKLLIGCGLREFSMTPGAIPIARSVVRETSARDMVRVAAKALTLGSVEEIERYVSEAVGTYEGRSTR